MPSDFLPILVLFIMAVGLGLLILVIARLLGPHVPTKAKAMPYESGMRPIGQAMRRLPIRYYLVATLFIVFDIEIVFLYPWAVVYKRMNPIWFGLVEILFFFLLVVLGYIYLLKKGALEWE
jgi:NADH-quinone oxidoreductase subunit A